MNKNVNCMSEVVVQGRFSSVTLCSECNLYYLHIGPMSFRLEADIFESVCQMFAELYHNRQLQNEVTGKAIFKH